MYLESELLTSYQHHWFRNVPKIGAKLSFVIGCDDGLDCDCSSVGLTPSFVCGCGECGGGDVYRRNGLHFERVHVCIIAKGDASLKRGWDRSWTQRKCSACSINRRFLWNTLILDPSSCKRRGWLAGLQYYVLPRGPLQKKKQERESWRSAGGMTELFLAGEPFVQNGQVGGRPEGWQYY